MSASEPDRERQGQAKAPARYATIPLRNKADVERRDALRERAEAALRRLRGSAAK